MKIEDIGIICLLTVATVVIAIGTDSSEGTHAHNQRLPTISIDPPGTWIQWFDKDCVPLGSAVFVPDRIDSYIKNRVPDSRGSRLNGPVGAVAAVSIDPLGKVRWYTPADDGSTVSSEGSTTPWQRMCLERIPLPHNI